MKKENNLVGKEYWRSLDQLADTPEFQKFLLEEFPSNNIEISNPLSRRKFLSLMGASLAFAGLAGCRKPVERIMPYVKAPENIVPGVPKYYATTMPMGLSSIGIVVESHEGRPTKIEGNEKHPASLGKSNAITQAAILGLYDPDRSKNVIHDGNKNIWTNFVSFWQEMHSEYSENQGEGLAILSESTASPTLYELYKQFKQNFPKAQWFTYEAVSDENVYKGLEIISGDPYQPVYNYSQAKIILSLDSDFLLTESEDITANLGFSAGRRVESENDSMNRLYVAESNYSITGGMADHRIPLRSHEIESFTVALAKEVNRQGLKINFPLELLADNELNIDQKIIVEIGKDLIKHKSNGLIVAGARQPGIVHALVFAINSALQNVGKTVEYKQIHDSLLPSSNSIGELAQLVNDNKISTLAILGGNPAYNAPSDVDFSNVLSKVGTSVHLSSYYDETSKISNWHIPLAHFLESWGDTKSADGTLSVIQPMIEPLFNGKGMVEVLNLVVTGKENSAYNIVKDHWTKLLPAINYDKNWRRTLHDGLLENSASNSITPKIVKSNLVNYLKNNNQVKINSNELEIVFQSSPALFDGRYANNGWLQELPDAITKLVWDNVLLISPATANSYNVENQDVVKISYNNKSMKLPVWILPGHANNSITVTLGYGRNAVGRIGNNVGYNAYRIRSSKSPDFDSGVTLIKTDEIYELANTQNHGSMEGRPIVREATLEEYKNHPTFAKDMVKHPPLESLWDEFKYDEGYQWGMSIDLNLCTGCNTCVLACQSENNIAVIGKEQVSNGREMHWIRMDRYFSGDLENPEMVHQPIACQHCEMAPCEQVCPVSATSHDKEGLNVMTYNRCVGTRYCSNNCPFKVRRFNYFNFTKDYPETIKMVQNPDVTVRSRGVMEKCTFCTQRINEKKINAKNEGREVRDGEILTACQQSCPANAIVFGNINDPESEVSKIKKRNLDYALLGELNLKARSTFLGKLRNPNPALIEERVTQNKESSV